jgi:drug/metabolite transporter (DMT)-like permease
MRARARRRSPPTPPTHPCPLRPIRVGGLFLAGLERLGPVRASVYSTLEPAFTLALAAAFLGEEVTPLRLAGGALILGAVVLLARAEAR